MNPGTRVDRFIIERLLGRGGMAEVYAARDTQLGRRVALKRLRGGSGDARSTVRFLREARFASAFHHPCAVVVYDIFEHENQPHIAMEFVEGRTLRSFVGDATIAASRRLRWLVDAARALGAAHRAGLVHRDVKPHNIMVTDDGRIKVLDFGIASMDRVGGKLSADESDDDSLASITQTGAIVGTPLYASPEQLSGRPVDGRSDQFSWALTAYELLCGYLPWRRRHAMTVLQQLAHDDIPSMSDRVAEVTAEARKAEARKAAQQSDPPGRDSDARTRSAPQVVSPALFASVPLGVEPVIACAMSRDPEQRFPTIDDAADALEEYAEDIRNVHHNATRSLRSVALSLRPRQGAGAAGEQASSGARPVISGLRGPTSMAPWTQRSFSTNKAPPDVGSASGSSSGTPAGATPFSVTSTPPISDTAESQQLSAAHVGSGEHGRTSRELGKLEPVPTSPTPQVTGLETVKRPLWRRPLFVAAAASMGLLAAMLGLSKIVDHGATGESAAGPAPVEVARVSCTLAEVRGQLAVPNAPALLGTAACMRLAAELGVEWSAPLDARGSGSIDGAARPEPRPAAEPGLRVVVDATASPVKVTLSYGGVEKHGEGAKPIEAIQAAIVPLLASLRAPAASPQARASWGAGAADDPARAVRELRRVGLLLSPDPRAELTRWSENEARSPWPWLMLAGTSPGGDAMATQARERALPAADALPADRATLVRGLLSVRVPARAGDVADGLRQLRRAYVNAPDDAEVAAGHAAALFHAGRVDEAMAVARRLFERGAAVTLPAFVLAADADPDPQWSEERGRLLDSLEAWVPEARGWPARARHELIAGKLEAARQSVDLAAALGLPWVARTGDLSRGWIALASLDVERARALARPHVGSPEPSVSDEALRILVQSYLLEGRAVDAQTELSRDIERQLAVGNERLLAARYVWLLSISRRLEQRAPSFIDSEKLRALADRLSAIEDPLGLSLKAELFAKQVLAGDEKQLSAEPLVKRAEAFATQVAQGDRTAHDAMLAAAAPLASYAFSAREQLAWWRALEKAPYSARLPHMLSIGQLCERQDDSACAEASYREAMRSPAATDGLDYVSARLRLARLLEKNGGESEAARLREPMSKLLAAADPEVAKRVQRLIK